MCAREKGEIEGSERWQQSKRLHWSEGEMTFDMAAATAAFSILNYICGSYLKSFHFISLSAFSLSPTLPFPLRLFFIHTSFGGMLKFKASVIK